MEPLLVLLARAPELPQAQALARARAAAGRDALPSFAQPQRMVGWAGSPGGSA
jgi:hypothetical protein